ncbi:unnamed protein product [Prunus armeniaca]
MPKPEEINRRQYCKWNNVWSHPIVNCVKFKDIVQEAINKGIFIIGEKAPAMLNDQNPFPPLQVNMVNLNCPNHTKRRITVETNAEDSLKPMKLIRPKASISLGVVLCCKCKCECDLEIEAHGQKMDQVLKRHPVFLMDSILIKLMGLAIDDYHPKEKFPSHLPRYCVQNHYSLKLKSVLIH